MTLEKLREALEKITGKDAISNARRRAILTQIYALMEQQ